MCQRRLLETRHPVPIDVASKSGRWCFNFYEPCKLLSLNGFHVTLLQSVCKLEIPRVFQELPTTIQEHFKSNQESNRVVKNLKVAK